MENNNNKILGVSLIIVSVIALIIGSTFAYWTWTSNNLVTVNITTNMGGIGLTLNGGTQAINNLAPASCTHSTYANKLPITISRYNETQYPALTTLSLKLTSLRYTHGTLTSNDLSYIHFLLSTQNNSCTQAVQGYDDEPVSGTLSNGTIGTINTAQSQNTTLVEWNYALPANSGTQASKINETYYLYVWIDPDYTFTNTGTNQIQDPLEDLEFTLTWSASDITQSETIPSPYVYTANIYDENVQGHNSVLIGEPIPNNIIQYQSPEAAMAALKTAGGGTTDYPFFLRHKIDEFSGWCIIMNNDTSNCLYSYPTESDCNTVLSGAPNDGNTYTCSNITVSNVVTESYVGFVITSTMAGNNPGMTAGTYYLKGGDNGAAYNANKAVLLRAFGQTYCTDYSSYFGCDVSGVTATADDDGYVGVNDGAGSYCEVSNDGRSYCEVNASGGDGPIIS